MSRPTVVYLACPMRKGHWSDNVRMASRAARDIMRKGYAVINPIGSWLCDLVEPMGLDDWLQNDYGLINCCDCLVRLPGDSEGSDLEMDYAVRHDKPVFTGTIDLYQNMPAEMEE